MTELLRFVPPALGVLGILVFVWAFLKLLDVIAGPPRS